MVDQSVDLRKLVTLLAGYHTKDRDSLHAPAWRAASDMGLCYQLSAYAFSACLVSLSWSQPPLVVLRTFGALKVNDWLFSVNKRSSTWFKLVVQGWQVAQNTLWISDLFRIGRKRNGLMNTASTSFHTTSHHRINGMFRAIKASEAVLPRFSRNELQESSSKLTTSES